MTKEYKMNLQNLRGQLLENEVLAPYTTWKIGGPARYLYKPADMDDLATFLANLPKDLAVLWLGKGSNVLISDSGFPGIVILPDNLTKIFQEQNNIIRVEAGAYSAFVAHQTIQWGLKGLEFLAGIPGTFGGALAMNAGAHGDELWNYVTKIETINRKGVRSIRTPAEYKISYRQVSPLFHGLEEWFITGYLQLQQGDIEEMTQFVQQLLEKRRATQPLNLPNAGSIFRNPPNDYAARLIEACNLKGFAIGDAAVSEKHANFIVNKGHATAQEIEELINYVAEVVKQRYGIELVREVKIIYGA